MNRYLQAWESFSRLPNDLAYGNHSDYVFLTAVGGRDGYEGFQRAVEMTQGGAGARAAGGRAAVEAPARVPPTLRLPTNHS
jgi:hypothetical protein